MFKTVFYNKGVKALQNFLQIIALLLFQLVCCFCCCSYIVFAYALLCCYFYVGMRLLLLLLLLFFISCDPSDVITIVHFLSVIIFCRLVDITKLSFKLHSIFIFYFRILFLLSSFFRNSSFSFLFKYSFWHMFKNVSIRIIHTIINNI